MTQFNKCIVRQRQSSSLACNGLLHVSSWTTGKTHIICPRMNSYILQTCSSHSVSSQKTVMSVYSIAQAKTPEAIHDSCFSLSASHPIHQPVSIQVSAPNLDAVLKDAIADSHPPIHSLFTRTCFSLGNSSPSEIALYINWLNPCHYTVLQSP